MENLIDHTYPELCDRFGAISGFLISGLNNLGFRVLFNEFYYNYYFNIGEIVWFRITGSIIRCWSYITELPNGQRVCAYSIDVDFSDPSVDICDVVWWVFLVDVILFD